MRVLNAAVPFVLLCPAFAQQPTAAQPWKWTLEQRLAVRFDPHYRAERIAEADVQNRMMEARIRNHAPTTATPRRAPGDVINGRDHPELLLPTELFEYFVRNLTWSDEFRRAYQQQATEIRSDVDWKALLERVEPFAANLREERKLLDDLDHATRPDRDVVNRRIVQLRSERCSVKKAALRSVRALLGKERFNRFLYETIAPSESITYDTTHSFDELRASLVAVEVNCQ